MIQTDNTKLFWAIDGGTAIYSGSDFNTRTIPGTFMVKTQGTADGISNMPVNAPGKLTVINVSGTVVTDTYQ